jgi:hypothetical protein
MKRLAITGGRWLGMLGMGICAAAIVLRLLGLFTVLGLGTGALLQAGMASILVGCFLLLLAQTQPH